MKITEEVRDFAAKQNTRAESFLEASPQPFALSLSKGCPSPRRKKAKGRASTSSARTALEETEAEAGVAEMSEKFREKGGEIYLPAAS
jgi:phosphomethylpyrimidine synthase